MASSSKRRNGVSIFPNTNLLKCNTNFPIVTIIVDNVGPVTWNKDAFERLVLPKKTKDPVKALVMVRTSKLCEQQGMNIARKRKRDDLIAGKGNGLIMLLHGGPGTGKTLTAESVAELVEMPLYNVTCGDIGTSADAVEKYLQTVLVLGNCGIVCYSSMRLISSSNNGLFPIWKETASYPSFSAHWNTMMVF